MKFEDTLKEKNCSEEKKRSEKETILSGKGKRNNIKENE